MTHHTITSHNTSVGVALTLLLMCNSQLNAFDTIPDRLDAIVKAIFDVYIFIMISLILKHNEHTAPDLTFKIQLRNVLRFNDTLFKLEFVIK